MLLNQFSMRSWKNLLLPALVVLMVMAGAVYLTNLFLNERDRNQINQFGSRISDLVNQNIANLNSVILLASGQFEVKDNFDRLSTELINQNPSILIVELWSNDKKLIKSFVNKRNQTAIPTRKTFPIWSEQYFQKAIDNKRPLFALPTKVATGSVDEFLAGNAIEFIVPLKNSTSLIVLIDTTQWMNIPEIENLALLNALSVELFDNFGSVIARYGPNLSKFSDVYQFTKTSFVYDLGLTLSISKLNLHSETNQVVAILIGGLTALFALLVFFVAYSYRLQEEFMSKVRLQELTILDQAKYSTLGEISTIISHEINQPLSAIEIYSSTVLKKLERDHQDVTEIKRLIEHTKSEVRRISKIISGVRQFITSSHSADEVTISANQVINNLREIITLQSKAYGCNLVINQIRDFKIKINPILLEQVVLNIARNAFEAMNAMDAVQKKLTISVNYENRQGRIEFDDTGPGISKESLDKIGTPFFTTKANSVGMGISLCKSLVERYHGTIEWHNSPHSGAIFTIKFFDVIGEL